jgi:ubiquinone/menaquinone biosynthesis C-methylase UbiE
MMTRSTTFRRRSYNATGHGYETNRYGESHMDEYRDLRNETLTTILGEAFGPGALKVLEVGCGTGPTLAYLAQSENRHVVFGVDASETMLHQAAVRVSELPTKPKLALGDASQLPYPDGCFDVVIATRFIHQFEHEVKRQLWLEFRRVLRHGGLVILEFYARPYHFVRYYCGARKGKSKASYFQHFPARSEVRDIVGEEYRSYPLRLAGSRLLARYVSTERVKALTRHADRFMGGVFLDEYFIASRKQ